MKDQDLIQESILLMSNQRINGEGMTVQEKFNEFMVTIGNHVFDLQFMITGLVCGILDEMQRESLDVSIDFPYRIEEKLQILSAERIIYDREDDRLSVITVDGMLIQWTDLDLSVQEQVVQEVHMEYVSEIIYRDLSSRDQDDDEEYFEI